MAMADWIINCLENGTDGKKLPNSLKNYISENADSKKLCVCAEDCILEKSDFDWKIELNDPFIFVQDGKEYLSALHLNKFKDSLALLDINPKKSYDRYDYSVFWYIPPKPKTKTIYTIQTTYDKTGDKRIRAYCETYDIAIREAQNHYNWHNLKPVGEAGIVPIEVIIE